MAYCITQQDPYSITKSLKVASPANPKISPPRVRPHNTIFLRTQSQLHFATMRSSSSSAPGIGRMRRARARRLHQTRNRSSALASSFFCCRPA